MKRLLAINLIGLLLILIITSCGNVSDEKSDKPVTIGLMLSEEGLGDLGVHDAAFHGLIRARNELGLVFDYRDSTETGNYEQGLLTLIEDGHNWIIGLGEEAKPAIEKAAQQFTDRSFIIIGATSDMSNVYSTLLSEEEISYLLGIWSGLKTNANKVAFIGGENDANMQNVKNKFIEGVHSVNPTARTYVDYVGNKPDNEKSTFSALKMVWAGVDYIFVHAGDNRVGAIQEAGHWGVHTLITDPIAELDKESKVITPVVANYEEIVYQLARQIAKSGKLNSPVQIMGSKHKAMTLNPEVLQQLSVEERFRLEKVLSVGAESIQ